MPFETLNESGRLIVVHNKLRLRGIDNYSVIIALRTFKFFTHSLSGCFESSSGHIMVLVTERSHVISSVIAREQFICDIHTYLFMKVSELRERGQKILVVGRGSNRVIPTSVA